MSINNATPDLVVKWLRHPSTPKRVLGVRSIREVSWSPDEAARRLVTAFQDETRSVKEAVAAELEQVGGQIGLQALLTCAEVSATERLYDQAVYLRMESAVEACLNGESSQILLAGLGSKSKYTRRLAAHAISKRPNAAYLFSLFDALYAVGEDYPTGQEILTAIAAINDKSAVPHLARLLPGHQIGAPLRGQLALAIASLGGVGADAPALLRELNSYRSYMINQDKAFTFLTAELRRQHGWKDLARSLTGCVASEMVRSLQGITEPEFGHELVQLLLEGHSTDTQKYIVGLLKNIPTTEVANALLQTVVIGVQCKEAFRSDLAEDVRISALLAAGGMADACGQTQVADLFEKFLERQVLLYETGREKNVFTHRPEAIFHAIGSINSCRAVPLMIRVLRSAYETEIRKYGSIEGKVYNLSIIVLEVLGKCKKEISPEDWKLIARCGY
jgi:HEAT repeat protein